MGIDTEIINKETGEMVNMTEPQKETMALEDVKDQINLIQQVMKFAMQDGQHYGLIPGCGDKKVLFKAGAEKLCLTFKMAPAFKTEVVDLGNGHREYRVLCHMSHIKTGLFLGEGVGSASTMEKKYRYRKDKQGNKMENADLAETFNTVLKIAKKRALVDATITVTAASDIFTQDLEDMNEPRPAIKPPQAKAVVTEPPEEIFSKPIGQKANDEIEFGDEIENLPPAGKPIGLVSDKQSKMLFAKCRAVGITDPVRQAYIRDNHHVEHLNELPWTAVEPMLKWIGAYENLDKS